jgi:hypothetical protein
LEKFGTKDTYAAQIVKRVSKKFGETLDAAAIKSVMS